jgi:hypothetical protein
MQLVRLGIGSRVQGRAWVLVAVETPVVVVVVGDVPVQIGESDRLGRGGGGG